jgi:hypothetical protein
VHYTLYYAQGSARAILILAITVGTISPFISLFVPSLEATEQYNSTIHIPTLINPKFHNETLLIPMVSVYHIKSPVIPIFNITLEHTSNNPLTIGKALGYFGSTVEHSEQLLIDYNNETPEKIVMNIDSEFENTSMNTIKIQCARAPACC